MDGETDSSAGCTVKRNCRPSCDRPATQALDSRTGATAGTDIVYNEMDSMVRTARSFNLHINVMKRLLNLENPQPGFVSAVLSTATPASQGLEEELLKQQVVLDMRTLSEKMALMRKEVEEMQVNGFCLAFNLQRQLKRLTGLPIDANATDDVVQNLWMRFNESKSSEAILKYEFEEKRKLLRRLRKELEQARRDWKNLKIRITDPVEDETEAGAVDSEWSEASQDSARLCSESDSAVHSDEGDEDSTRERNRQSIQARSRQLDQLEKECLQFVTQLVTTGGSTSNPSSRRQQLAVAGDEDEERFHSPMPVPDFYVQEHLLIESSGDEEYDEDGSAIVPESDDSDLDDDDDDDDDIDLEAVLAADGGLGAFVDDLLASGGVHTGYESNQQLTPASDGPMAGGSHTGSLLDVGSSDLQTGLMRSRASSRSSRFDEEEEARLRQESLAETGEPIVLCRLRRKAVEVLVSRLREEKAFHESREKELECRLKDVTARNKRLEDQKGERLEISVTICEDN